MDKKKTIKYKKNNMKVLSVKQPWAYLLCAGIKDVENRTWKLPEDLKGQRVLIHASAKWDTNFLFSIPQCKFLSKDLNKKIITRNIPISAIIGSVIFTDCVVNHKSVWAESIDDFDIYLNNKEQIFNWIVESPILFDKPILNVKGNLKFWEASDEIIKQLKL